MNFLVICFVVVALILVLASTFLTASSFLRLIAIIFRRISRKKALQIWVIIVGLYLLSEIVIGYGVELLFVHLNFSAHMTILLLDFLDAMLTLYGIASALLETAPNLPLIRENPTSAFALSFGMFLFSLLGLFFVYSLLPQTAGLVLGFCPRPQ